MAWLSVWRPGSAGCHGITRPGFAATLQRRKIRDGHSTGATVPSTSNPGGHRHSADGLRRAGAPIMVSQPVGALARTCHREAITPANACSILSRFARPRREHARMLRRGYGNLVWTKNQPEGMESAAA